MLFDFPDEVVALIVPYLVDYRDFRQLLWLCRAGGSILARVRSLDVDGVYACYRSCNPFDYCRFHALLRVSVTIRWCSFHVYYDFVQFTGVRELNLRLPVRVTNRQLHALMVWLEHDLSDELSHVSIHLAYWNLRRPRVRERFAQHILMLSNHNTLDSFSVSIAGEPFTILWACQQLGMDPPAHLAGAPLGARVPRAVRVYDQVASYIHAAIHY
jgi:hypothetical protein